MPITLRKLGFELSDQYLDRESKIFVEGKRGRVFGGVLGSNLELLDGELFGLFTYLYQRISKNGKISSEEWSKIKRQVLQIELMTPFFNFKNRISASVKSIQKEAFSKTSKHLSKVAKELYPSLNYTSVSKKKYQEMLNKLDFGDSQIERNFLSDGIEVHEDVSVEVVLSMFLSPFDSSGDWALAKKLNEVAISIGTGRINDDFLMFLKRQLEVGYEPADLITTVSTRHIADIQKALLSAVNSRLDVATAQKDFMKGITDEVMGGQSRKTFSYNVLRIMRTSHQRASTSATSLFGFANSHIIGELERVADGRPCIACTILDGTRYPVGSTISDHPNGMAHWGRGAEKIQCEFGSRHIRDLVVGDKVFTDGKNIGQVKRIEVFRYTGLAYEFFFEWEDNGRRVFKSIRLTPEHPFMLLEKSDSVARACQRIAENPSQWLNGHTHFGIKRNHSKIDHSAVLTKFSTYWLSNEEVIHFEVSPGHTYFCDNIWLHNCVFVPVAKTLGDLGFDEQQVPEKYRAAFRQQTRPYPTMKSRFLKMSENEQRKIFGNNKLYELWKRERFPLEALVVKRNGMFVPDTYSSIAAKIDKIGGISSPLASIGYVFTKIKSKPVEIEKLIAAIDPLDRASKSTVIVREEDLSKDIKGQKKFGEKTDNVNKQEAADAILKAQKNPGVEDWNDYYRTIGSYRRRLIGGGEYFAIPKSVYDRML